MFPLNPEQQIEIERLAAALLALPIGQTANYADLSAVVGHDVRDNRIPLLKARQKVEKETGLRFATVRREGVKKLDAEAVAGIGIGARKTIAKKARYAAGRLTGLRYNGIDREMQQRLDAERSLLGAISATAKADISRVEEMTQTGPVVAAKVFDMMNRAA